MSAVVPVCVCMLVRLGVCGVRWQDRVGSFDSLRICIHDCNYKH